MQVLNANPHGHQGPSNCWLEEAQPTPEAFPSGDPGPGSLPACGERRRDFLHLVKPLWVLHSTCGLPQFSELSTGPNCSILSSCNHPETASVKCFDGAGFWKVLWATANKITSKIELGCLTFQNTLLRHLKYCLLHSPAPLRHPKRSSFSYSVCTFAAWDISFCFSLMLFSIPQGEC